MRSSSTDAHALQDENSVLKEVLEKTINEVRAHMQCPRARASVCVACTPVLASRACPQCRSASDARQVGEVTDEAYTLQEIVQTQALEIKVRHAAHRSPAPSS